MVVEKEYYSLNDAAKLKSCSADDLIYLGAEGRLKIGFLLNYTGFNIKYKVFSENDELELELTLPDVYKGLVSLLPFDLRELERTGGIERNTEIALGRFDELMCFDSQSHFWSHITKENIQLSSNSYTRYTVEVRENSKTIFEYAGTKCLKNPIKINKNNLFIKSKDLFLDGLKVEVQKDKPLSKIERETLLIIIAALAKESKVDITKISKAGEQIASMTQQLGSPIGATTIETHLKKIILALENRAK